VKVAYIHGLLTGDISAWRDRNGIVKVQVCTTHPAMERLFIETFLPLSSSGNVYKYPESTKMPRPGGYESGYEWRLRIHIDRPYRELILMLKKNPKPQYAEGDLELLAAYTAGFSDSDGSWEPKTLYGSFEFRIINSNKELLEYLQKLWRKYDINFRITIHTRKGKGKRRIYKRDVWLLAVSRKEDLLRITKIVGKYVRHPEKIEKVTIIRKYLERKASLEQTLNNLKELKERIKKEVQESIKQAIEELKRKS